MWGKTFIHAENWRPSYLFLSPAGHSGCCFGRFSPWEAPRTQASLWKSCSSCLRKATAWTSPPRALMSCKETLCIISQTFCIFLCLFSYCLNSYPAIPYLVFNGTARPKCLEIYECFYLFIYFSRESNLKFCLKSNKPIFNNCPKSTKTSWSILILVFGKL